MQLPSGCTISDETWGWIVEEGDWRGLLDARMYDEGDSAFLDAQVLDEVRVIVCDPERG